MKKIFYITLLSLIISCQPNHLEMDGLNLDKWKLDKNGCLNYRHQNIQQLIDSKEQLFKASEVSIVQSLGKPNRIELIEKSQKIYVYFLGKSEICNPTPVTNSVINVMHVRFNSMGYCNNVVIVEEQLGSNN